MNKTKAIVNRTIMDVNGALYEKSEVKIDKIDKNNKMNLSIKDINGSILVVSQFTLCASIKKGNRPSFLNAAPPLIGKDLYKNFILHLKSFGVPVSSGNFGAMMDVYLINQGPATFIIDSRT